MQLAHESGFFICFTPDFQSARNRDGSIVGESGDGIIYLDYDDVIGPVCVTGTKGADGHRDFRQNEEMYGRCQWRGHEARDRHFAAFKAYRLVRKGQSLCGVAGVDLIEGVVFCGCGQGDRPGQGERHKGMSDEGK